MRRKIKIIFLILLTSVYWKPILKNGFWTGTLKPIEKSNPEKNFYELQGISGKNIDKVAEIEIEEED